MYHYTDGGLRNIWLSNGYTVKQTPYGEAVSIQDLDGLTKAICNALIRKKTKLTGAEFRYIREAMLMSQASMGKALGRSNQAVAIWEKTSKIPKAADLLLRVLYAAHADGNEKVKNLVHAMNTTERTIHIIMQDTSKGWRSTETDEEPEELAEAA